MLWQVASLRIGGEPVEGERVTAIAVYFGEADHSFKFQWYRREPGFEPLELIEGATKAGLTGARQHGEADGWEMHTTHGSGVRVQFLLAKPSPSLGTWMA